MQILLYDDKEMHIHEIIGYFPKPPEEMEFDATTLEDMFSRKIIITKGTYKAEITVGEQKAELDPTTMKRIAKYNFDKEFEEINRKIKSAKDKLKSLEKEMKEKERKLQVIQKLGQAIWNDDCFDEDDYLRNGDDEDEWE